MNSERFSSQPSPDAYRHPSYSTPGGVPVGGFDSGVRNAAQAETSQPALVEERDRLNNLVRLNRELIENLYARLDGILQPLPPSDAKLPGRPMAPVGSLTESFTHIGSRVDDQNCMLQGLLKRLEV
jgi:hypothetical protein